MFEFCIFITFASCYAQDDGVYVQDNSGAYVPTGDEGRYIPDDSGKYIPDYSGLYHHDGTGRYVNDGSGKYDSSRNGKYPHYLSKHTGRKSIYFSNLETAGTVLSKNIVKPKLTSSANTNRNFRNLRKNEHFDNGKWKIIRQINHNDIKGYHWEFETENKINAEEFAKFDMTESDQEALKTNGYFSYTGPDDMVYSIMYTADEKGFIPKGDHLPISLQKALAQISSIKN
ncbi:larval cuticle protein LCP-30-like isoform X2 [Anoplophora glabripennis]|uniref:larval cuticle protein LCP-30-like isoform X2 n=1 Tax=Anoplophora glabripennis TaxID=217634 RepID=UPI000873AA32|nr:larval cuticle protein LCP-30-like isoform X2 [Anoplophora glabripennis]